MPFGATEMTRHARNFPKIQEIEINDLSIQEIAADKSDARPPPASPPIKDPRGPDPNQSSGAKQFSYISTILIS